MYQQALKRGAAAGLLAAGVAVLLPSGVAGADPGAGSGNGNGPSSAQSGTIPGNDGHVQVDQYVLDPGSDNDPHVGCGFSVSFFGYDSGPQEATITITPWAPTGGGHPATLGPVTWDVGQRTGGDQLDANFPVTAAEVEAVFGGVTPAAQGYHAKIEVEVTGSRGSDDKFHVVWITPCSTSGGGGPIAGGQSGSGASGVGGSSGSGNQGAGGPVVAPSSGSAGPPPTTGGSSGTGAPTPPALAPALPAPTTAGARQLPVLTATEVHTGEPWAGATPLEVAGMACGLGCIGWGLRRRRAVGTPSR